MMTCNRARRAAILQLSALPLGALLPSVAAVDAGAVLNALPRIALVCGNGKYRDLPELQNPGSDASALAAKLKEMGFDTSLRLDSGKAEMERAIAEFGGKIARQKGVGLFYFAGHGLQLSWRNFLIPTDARLGTADDVVQRAVDLVAVIDSLRQAHNPMNVVILDACRDNPFASDLKTGKGLGQIDAPAGTLLAYSTAPGNTASDGEGKNGLYTSHLLNEISRPEAKIEDVFKRVRLNVRRASHGSQIPWESTSLEDDFYFLPPPQVRKASQEELDRQYAEELDVWKRVEAKVATADRSLSERMK